MSEWFKEHDWKSCDWENWSGGSNPLLCARNKGVQRFCRTLFLSIFFWKISVYPTYYPKFEFARSDPPLFLREFCFFRKNY